MLARMIGLATVAFALATILIWENPGPPRAVFRFAFFFGLASLAVYFFARPPGMSSIYINFGRGTWAYLIAGLFSLMALLPFVVLLEIGIVGYRCFSTFMRYVSLTIAILGLAGLVASLLLPMLRHH